MGGTGLAPATSTGPAWLDAGHAATNLAIAFGHDAATRFLASCGATTGRACEDHWLVMDAVGFLPPPGREPMFSGPGELQRLDEWLHRLVGGELQLWSHALPAAD